MGIFQFGKSVDNLLVISEELYFRSPGLVDLRVNAELLVSNMGYSNNHSKESGIMHILSTLSCNNNKKKERKRKRKVSLTCFLETFMIFSLSFAC